MFRAVPLSVIRSFSLYTQQWYVSKPVWHIPLLCVQWKTAECVAIIRSLHKDTTIQSSSPYHQVGNLPSFTLKYIMYYVKYMWVWYSYRRRKDICAMALWRPACRTETSRQAVHDCKAARLCVSAPTGMVHFKISPKYCYWSITPHGATLQKSLPFEPQTVHATCFFRIVPSSVMFSWAQLEGVKRWTSYEQHTEIQHTEIPHTELQHIKAQHTEIQQLPLKVGSCPGLSVQVSADLVTAVLTSSSLASGNPSTVFSQCDALQPEAGFIPAAVYICSLLHAYPQRRNLKSRCLKCAGSLFMVLL